ncbi:MAG: DUF3052 domain-containing protein [Deltaproteobacteria bacterium]|nr:DUF3052 domain-containing protein [Deltaproteobacteria bacterium]MCW5803525.1 DUF3052 domain-containing protein [Deltaproteobacteria bacterium]
MAGYPGTPLPKKLGIKAGHKVCLLNAPGSFERQVAQDEVRITHDLRLPPVDVVVLFVDRIADLERRFADIAARLHPAGGFWVAFRSVRGCDITDEVVRRIALAAGMVDNKVCTFDTWSAMRLVLRQDIRDAVAYRAIPPPPLSRRMRRPSSAPARIAHRTLSRSSGAGSSMRRARARSTK